MILILCLIESHCGALSVNSALQFWRCFTEEVKIRTRQCSIPPHNKQPQVENCHANDSGPFERWWVDACLPVDEVGVETGMLRHSTSICWNLSVRSNQSNQSNQILSVCISTTLGEYDDEEWVVLAWGVSRQVPFTNGSFCGITVLQRSATPVRPSMILPNKNLQEDWG